MADMTTEVDARPAEKMHIGVSPLENSGTGRREPRQRVIMRSVVRILRVLLSWLARATSLLGWLVRASFRWIVVVPALNAQLAHQYRKTGEQAYRNTNGEDQGGMIREQIRAIDNEANVISSGVEEGSPNGMPKSHSRVALLAVRVMRRLKQRQLLALLGEELVGREPINEELCRFVQQARSTQEIIRRTKAQRPVKCGVGNFSIGLAALLVIACAWYLRRNASGVTDMGEAPTMFYDSSLGEWFPANNNNRDKSDSETTPVNPVAKTLRRPPSNTAIEENDAAIRNYIAAHADSIRRIPLKELDGSWYRYGVDQGVLWLGYELGSQKIKASRPPPFNDVLVISHDSMVETVINNLATNGFSFSISGYISDGTSKQISSEKLHSLIRGVYDGLEKGTPESRYYGIAPPVE